MVKRSKAEWLSLFEAQSKSGLSAAAFCREHKLNSKYFSLRRKQLMNDALSTSESIGKVSNFVPAVIAPPSARDICITTGQVTATIPTEVKPEWLAGLMKCLQN